MNRAQTSRGSVLWGAAFLMATSAIGPGFLTQTSVFTAQFAASFGFVILVSGRPGYRGTVECLADHRRVGAAGSGHRQ